MEQEAGTRFQTQLAGQIGDSLVVAELVGRGIGATAFADNVRDADLLASANHPGCRLQAKAWPIALFGDGHTVDFAMVPRLSGRNPMQMPGWGCSVVPSRMREERRALVDTLRSTAKAAGIDGVIYADGLEARRAQDQLVP
ncbi:MAG: hypothetical protein C0524_03725 [Rhodobacter sp.]|nr:hypothetical protein [Rhodobacter sp.]